jgi:Tn3 transposase DDE domain
MNTCSCLNLILACIVYWQAREISRVLIQCDPVANGADLTLLEHVSPIEWDNVVLLRPVYPRSETRPPSPSLHEGRS